MCIRDSPNGNGMLSEMDLSALSMLRFDAMVALGVQKAKPYLTTIGLAWGTLQDEKPKSLLYPSLQQLLQLDFAAMLSTIEKNAVIKEDITLNAKVPRVLLVALQGKSTPEQAEASLNELAELAKTAGVEVVDQVLQKKIIPEPATYLGKGKVEELCFLCQTKQIDSLIFDDELSPVQMRNLEFLTGKAIIDRSMLILDIFAQRAKSKEGKLQVELAQLNYMLPRLVGQGEALSRLGGGIGTRGPGETKLEVDKRRIRRRIFELERRLEQVVKTRTLHRQRRQAQHIPVVALVGYTNAGKSTLLNHLTAADVWAEDQLFATLDTTTRKLSLPGGSVVLLTDTVGFIRKLPHHLVAAFRATLEEVTAADLLLHVLDVSSEQAEEQAEAVQQVLQELGCADKPTLTVCNKIDQLAEPGVLARFCRKYEPAVGISAKQEIGLAELLAQIEQLLPQQEQRVELLLPYQSGNWLARLHKEGKILQENYEEDGIALVVMAPIALRRALEKAGILPKRHLEEE